MRQSIESQDEPDYASYAWYWAIIRMASFHFTLHPGKETLLFKWSRTSSGQSSKDLHSLLNTAGCHHKHSLLTIMLTKTCKESKHRAQDKKCQDNQRAHRVTLLITAKNIAIFSLLSASASLTASRKYAFDISLCHISFHDIMYRE